MMRSEVLMITPEAAAEMLRKNSRNRALMLSHVQSLASQMKAGQFRTTHQGIAFLEDGTLADGQHRLAAIVMSGVTVKMMVTVGLTSKEVDAVDWNTTPRRLHDVYRMTGESPDSWLTDKTAIGVINVLMRRFAKQGGGRKLQGDIVAIRSFYNHYRVILDPIFSQFFRLKGDEKRTAHSNAIAVYASCYYASTIELDTLGRFHKIISTGEYNSTVPGEFVAISFRESLLRERNIWRDDPIRTAKRMMRAIQAFAAGEDIRFVQTPEKFIYIIPA